MDAFSAQRPDPLGNSSIGPRETDPKAESIVQSLKSNR